MIKMSIDWRPLIGNYQLGRTYRDWVRTQPQASNAAIRSALQDFTAGTPISISLAIDIATNRLLLISVRSLGESLDRGKCELIIDELKINYNENAIGQARSFLEGFSNFPEGYLNLPLQSLKTDVRNTVNKKQISNNHNQLKSSSNAVKLYVEGAHLAIKALLKVETYAYYVIWMASIDWQIAKTDFNLRLIVLQGYLGVFFYTAIIIIFDKMAGNGSGFEGMGSGYFGPKEYLRKSWKSWKVSFFAGLSISLGLLLFVVPGIVLAIRYMYVSQVAVLENCNTDAALKRSRELSLRGRWSVIIANLLALLTYFILMIAMYLIVGDQATKSTQYAIFVMITGAILGVWNSSIMYLGYKNALMMDEVANSTNSI